MEKNKIEKVINDCVKNKTIRKFEKFGETYENIVYTINDIMFINCHKFYEDVYHVALYCGESDKPPVASNSIHIADIKKDEIEQFLVNKNTVLALTIMIVGLLYVTLSKNMLRLPETHGSLDFNEKVIEIIDSWI